MGERLVVGPFNNGLKNDRTAFVIDNDAFPTLINAYAWRGRVKRKRGTRPIARFSREVMSTLASPLLTLDGSGNGSINLLTAFALESPSVSTEVGSIGLNMGAFTFSEPPNPSGILIGTYPGSSGTIDYSTGLLTITNGIPGSPVWGSYFYYPGLPVMGLEELQPNLNDFALYPGTLGFDTVYSYLFDTTNSGIIDVSFYKNLLADPSILPAYVPKATLTPLKWTGADYQQFWSCNYQGAFWATNGVPGMAFRTIEDITDVTAGPPALATLHITNHGLVNGDFIYINEVIGTSANLINNQTGYVIDASDPNEVIVELPNANLTGFSYSSNGMVQYLTNNVTDISGHKIYTSGIRWYDGDPLLPLRGLGWVNFAPPLSSVPVSIGQNPAAQYYLCGAKMVIPFKNRLLFVGPYITTSGNAIGNAIYLQDYIIYSEVGTPYYTSSYDATLTAPTQTPMLVPVSQVAEYRAFFSNLTGYGGYITAGVEEPIRTVVPEKDVLIMGFASQFAQLVYNGNDILPFSFYSITKEWGSTYTFGSLTFDRGAVTLGNYGITRTGIEGSERIDLSIPDQIFQLSNANHAADRVCGQRNYIAEWAYFSYPSINEAVSSYFPNQTLFYNYRDQTWALFDETFTSYGIYRQTGGLTWLTLTYANWSQWNDPWISGNTNIGNPVIIAGNQQGFVVQRDYGTEEADSLYISSVTTNLSGYVVINSPNHSLINGDYIYIQNCLGTISADLNNKIFTVESAEQDTFELKPGIPFTGQTYIGAGTIKRMYVPQIRTKQFPSSWSMSRKTRIGGQNYLFSKTESGAVTVDIYLSQCDIPFNNIIDNSAVLYSTEVNTNPEYEIANLTNLLIGNGKLGNGVATTINIILESYYELNFGIEPGSLSIKVGNVATFTDNGTGLLTATGTGVSGTVNYDTTTVSLVFSVAPTASDLFYSTFKYYIPSIISPTGPYQQQIWHRMNTSLLGDTVQVGITLNDTQMRAKPIAGKFPNQFAEIELHGFIFDLSPSQVLA